MDGAPLISLDPLLIQTRANYHDGECRSECRSCYELYTVKEIRLKCAVQNASSSRLLAYSNTRFAARYFLSLLSINC